MSGIQKKQQSTNKKTDSELTVSKLKYFIWEKDTVVVNGCQMTVMFPPDPAGNDN